MLRRYDPKKGHRPQRYQPWSKGTCAGCGKEGYAARAFAWEGVYVCDVCDGYTQGYNDAISAMREEARCRKKVMRS